jgi:hypothetical protein
MHLVHGCSISIIEAWLPVLAGWGAGLVCAVLAFGFNFPWRRWLLDNDPALEWSQELLLHASFYGSALLAFIGLGDCGSPWWLWLLWVVYTVPCLFASYVFAWRRHKREHRWLSERFGPLLKAAERV